MPHSVVLIRAIDLSTLGRLIFQAWAENVDLWSNLALTRRETAGIVGDRNLSCPKRRPHEQLRLIRGLTPATADQNHTLWLLDALCLLESYFERCKEFSVLEQILRELPDSGLWVQRWRDGSIAPLVTGVAKLFKPGFWLVIHYDVTVSRRFDRSYWVDFVSGRNS